MKAPGQYYVHHTKTVSPEGRSPAVFQKAQGLGERSKYYYLFHIDGSRIKVLHRSVIEADIEDAFFQLTNNQRHTARYNQIFKPMPQDATEPAEPETPAPAEIIDDELSLF